MFSQHNYASFYFPIGRIWELLFGTFIAFYLRVNYSNTKTFSRKFNELFSLLALLMIIVAVIYFDNRDTSSFPNCYTLIPTGRAALIILLGDSYIGLILYHIVRIFDINYYLYFYVYD